jgi:hypothetical protein
MIEAGFRKRPPHQQLAHCSHNREGDRVRRIGVLMPFDENDPVQKAFVSAFTQGLAGLGWTEGRNVRMEVRFAGADINRMRALAQELVGLRLTVALTTTNSARLRSFRAMFRNYQRCAYFCVAMNGRAQQQHGL